ncbi:DUF3034 family protein [Salinisphaera aquimarina]
MPLLSAHAEGSRLWATGGITNINGSAGGGITTWAVLNGYASDTETTANASVSHVGVDDFGLNTASIGVNWANRLAVTVSHSKLDVQPLHTDIRQQTVGLKLRLAGEALYDRFGQYSAGVQYTHNSDFAIPHALGARNDSGVDFYLAATKVVLDGFLSRNVLLNATARATRANQLGLLGFGSEHDNGYDLVGEFSAGVFLNRKWLVGAEYRQKPNNLQTVDEDDWKSVYLVYAPSRYLALSMAYVDLGSIAGLDDQNGYFVSLQTGF